MKPEQTLVIGLGIVIVASVLVWEAMTGGIGKGTEITPEMLTIGMGNPTLWIFYTTSEVNARQWWDFGARNSRALNIPLLNMLYTRIAEHNGKTYRIEVLGGVSAVAEKLGWDAMPRSLRSSGKATVTGAEEAWIRTAILAKYGGLWLSPSVVSLKPIGELPRDAIVAFGQDDVPMYGSSSASSASSAMPAFNALWVPIPNHPMMVEWEERLYDRLEGQLGGREVRGDSKSDWVELSRNHVVKLAIDKELSRNPETGKKLELEDLFAAGTEGRIPFTIPPTTSYIVIPYADLRDRRAWGWILRESEEQLMESDLAIVHVMRG